MTVRFAAARTATPCSPIARALARRAVGRVANDNGDADGSHDRLLAAALRHFATHGMGAAREARRQAEAALFEDDAQGFKWWLGICRTLDRRMAAQLLRATAS